MKYFFLFYAIVAVSVVGIFKYRGHTFNEPPIQLLPDMDDQDVLKAQKQSAFFSDGQGSRQPVTETAPRGFQADGQTNLGGIPEYEFSGGTGYYYTGHIGDYFGTGMPEELKLTAENSVELLKRGEERYNVYCGVCHGKSGDGAGVTSLYGVPGIANLVSPPYAQASYPDGRLFEVITKGKGNMSGYGYNIPVRDRWAIIAYIRAMQMARSAPLELVKDAYESGKALQEAASSAQ
jgi:mono/diheme cytochrome c family protein